VTGIVFDTGALIAVDRGDRTVMVVVAEARKGNDTITVPAGCVAQAWRMPARQARLAAFLRMPNVAIVSLDDQEARLVGLLLGHARARDIADGHVALCAHRLNQVVLTSDPKDLRAIGPRLKIQRV
jgi:predicted nucleic acid-binding protein